MMNPTACVDHLMTENCTSIMPRLNHRTVLTIVFCVGVILRFLNPAQIAIDHFDEGIYAQTGLWIYEPNGLRGIDPAVIPYGPPAMPVLIGLSYLILGGPSDFAAIMPGLICGCISVLLIYQFNKRLFGTTAGLLAATFLATSGMAIAFSRSALTDAPLICIWLLTMLAGLNFLERPGLKNAIVMGLGVGLSQLTKYNGGLTGIIIAMTVILDFISNCNDRQNAVPLLRRRIAWGIVGAGIALATYAPWYQFVERHGGYQSLMRHHSGYVGTLSQWPDHLRLQWLQAWTFHQQYWPKAVLLILVVFIWQSCRPSNAIENGGQFKIQNGMRNLILNLLLLSLVFVLPNACWTVAVLMSPRLWRSGRAGERLLVVWFLFMTILTPIYHPYARLWLPTVIAGISITARFFADDLCLSFLKFNRDSEARASVASVAITSIILVIVSIPVWKFSKIQSPIDTNIWSNKSGLHDEVAEMKSRIIEKLQQHQHVFMLVSPAVRWQLQFELSESDTGAGRLSSLSALTEYRPSSGPLLLDMSLLAGQELPDWLQKSRALSDDQADKKIQKSQRGLITILDLMPDALHRPDRPATELILIGQ